MHIFSIRRALLSPFSYMFALLHPSLRKEINCFNPYGAKWHICRLSVECQKRQIRRVAAKRNICHLISLVRYHHAWILKGNYSNIIYVHSPVNILSHYYSNICRKGLIWPIPSVQPGQIMLSRFQFLYIWKHYNVIIQLCYIYFIFYYEF